MKVNGNQNITNWAAITFLPLESIHDMINTVKASPKLNSSTQAWTTPTILTWSSEKLQQQFSLPRHKLVKIFQLGLSTLVLTQTSRKHSTFNQSVKSSTPYDNHSKLYQWTFSKSESLLIFLPFFSVQCYKMDDPTTRLESIVKKSITSSWKMTPKNAKTFQFIPPDTIFLNGSLNFKNGSWQNSV